MLEKIRFLLFGLSEMLVFLAGEQYIFKYFSALTLNLKVLLSPDQQSQHHFKREEINISCANEKISFLPTTKRKKTLQSACLACSAI